MDDKKLVSEVFNQHFQRAYDGSKDDEYARADFMRLTNFQIVWTQVHGDFKDVAKRATFQSYPHWRELHECCGIAVRETIAADKMCLYSDIMCARIMGAAMAILRSKYGFNAPKWWIAVMNQLRARPIGAHQWNPGI